MGPPVSPYSSPDAPARGTVPVHRQPGRALSAALGAVALLTAVSASAAEPPDQTAAEQTVGERPRTTYDPAGIRAGGFLLLPSVEFGVGSDDNIYKKGQGTVGSPSLSVRPRITGVSQWRNHELQLEAGLDSDFYRDVPKENATDWFASTGGRLDIVRDAWASAALAVRGQHEARGEPDAPETAEQPVYYRVLSARSEAFWRINRLSLGLKGSYIDTAFENARTVTGQRLVQNDRDRGEAEVAARIGWELTPGYEAFVRATGHVRRYPRPQGEQRYDRDSNGTEVVAGTRLELGGLLVGDIYAGYRSQVYDDARLPTVETLSYGGALTWNVTRLTTIRGTVGRTVGETTRERVSGTLSTEYALGADHELRRNLLLGATFGVTTGEYEGVAVEDNVLRSGIRGTWLINRNWHTELGYRFERKDSTAEGGDYRRNVVFLNVRFQM